MTASVAIIGGGPAGLMAAERLSTAGHRVTVYDRMLSLGRKFLMAGRGGLNLTHSETRNLFLPRYGAAAPTLEPLIDAFPPEALIAWCEGLGQKTFIGSSGRVFPVAMKASPLLRAWLRRLDAQGVTFQLRQRWLGWDSAQRLIFEDDTGAQHACTADATILALGGASWPKLGSDGGWAPVLQAQGIGITPLRPANMGFTVVWSPHFAGRFAGQPLKPVVLHFGETRQQGELMITAQGLEGGAIYALSSQLREAMAKAPVILYIDLRPGVTLDELTQRLAAPRSRQSLATVLRKAAGLSPVAAGLLREAGALPVAADRLAGLIKSCPVTLTAAAPLARAISTAGGVAWDGLDAELMLKNRPGIFVAGEMLDWEAPTGGYLLQGCFSTGIGAAAGALRWLAAR